MNEAVAVQPRKFWMRWRVRTGYPVAILYLLLATPSDHWIALGGGIAGLGLIIRAIAAGHLRKDRELATTGPYARTRNPLYLGSLFLAIGFAIAGHSWWAGSLVLIYFAVFYYAVMRNEERDLRARFGVIYDQYAARVPLFLPNFFDSGHVSPTDVAPEQGFSWALYRRNREYKALIGTIAGLAVVWLRAWLRQHYGY
ncbi:MAG: isoprenylcysteine carboxylmethyltransferase family protein [Candidatus Acidiferrales bacterium]